MLSLGGVVGGVLSALVAPLVFKTVLEYQHRQELHGQALDNDHVIAGVQVFF